MKHEIWEAGDGPTHGGAAAQGIFSLTLTTALPSLTLRFSWPGCMLLKTATNIQCVVGRLQHLTVPRLATNSTSININSMIYYDNSTLYSKVY